MASSQCSSGRSQDPDFSDPTYIPRTPSEDWLESLSIPYYMRFQQTTEIANPELPHEISKPALERLSPISTRTISNQEEVSRSFSGTSFGSSESDTEPFHYERYCHTLPSIPSVLENSSRASEELQNVMEDRPSTTEIPTATNYQQTTMSEPDTEPFPEYIEPDMTAYYAEEARYREMHAEYFNLPASSTAAGNNSSRSSGSSQMEAFPTYQEPDMAVYQQQQQQQARDNEGHEEISEETENDAEQQSVEHGGYPERAIEIEWDEQANQEQTGKEIDCYQEQTSEEDNYPERVKEIEYQEEQATENGNSLRRSIARECLYTPAAYPQYGPENEYHEEQDEEDGNYPSRGRESSYHSPKGKEKAVDYPSSAEQSSYYALQVGQGALNYSFHAGESLYTSLSGRENGGNLPSRTGDLSYNFPQVGPGRLNRLSRAGQLPYSLPQPGQGAASYAFHAGQSSYPIPQFSNANANHCLPGSSRFASTSQAHHPPESLPSSQQSYQPPQPTTPPRRRASTSSSDSSIYSYYSPRPSNLAERILRDLTRTPPPPRGPNDSPVPFETPPRGNPDPEHNLPSLQFYLLFKLAVPRDRFPEYWAAQPADAEAKSERDREGGNGGSESSRRAGSDFGSGLGGRGMGEGEGGDGSDTRASSPFNDRSFNHRYSSPENSDQKARLSNLSTIVEDGSNASTSSNSRSQSQPSSSRPSSQGISISSIRVEDGFSSVYSSSDDDAATIAEDTEQDDDELAAVTEEVEREDDGYDAYRYHPSSGSPAPPFASYLSDPALSLHDDGDQNENERVDERENNHSLSPINEEDEEILIDLDKASPPTSPTELFESTFTKTSALKRVTSSKKTESKGKARESEYGSGSGSATNSNNSQSFAIIPTTQNPTTFPPPYNYDPDDYLYLQADRAYCLPLQTNVVDYAYHRGHARRDGASALEVVSPKTQKQTRGLMQGQSESQGIDGDQGGVNKNAEKREKGGEYIKGGHTSWEGFGSS